MRTMFLFVVLGLTAPATASAQLVVSTDFPGGSAAVEQIDQPQRRIRLKPADYPDRGWACWWYFRLDGITPGETVTLDVGDAPWATPDRAAFSLDGDSWQQTSPGERRGKRIVYRQKIDADQAWFAWGPPFVPRDAQQLIERAARRLPESVTQFVLCKTRRGRPTPALRIAAPERENPPKSSIWIQARQHAWESGSSWVAAGLVDWLISDEPAAGELRQSAVITIVPIMDVDNVVLGAGGKNQVPQDHNRDWTDQPYWRSVIAAQSAIRAADAAGHFDLFVDLHNPGAGARDPYFFVPPDGLLSQRRQRNLRWFLDAAEAEMTGPLAFRGRTIPSGRNYDDQWQAMSKNWVAAHCNGHVVAVTLETPWNTPHSTAAGYQQVGRELGEAIARYLREDVRR